MKIRSSAFTLLASACVALTTLTAGSVADFVYPKSPLEPRKRRAPSPKVTNGTVFESGALTVKKGQTLVLPDDAVVEQHEGPAVRFFLTKTQRCMGQSPVPMHYAKSRQHFGIAQQLDKGAVVIATYGEWSNRGGSGRIKLLVMVPKSVTYKLEKGLSGNASKARTRHNPGDKALKDCYWYAGTQPAEGWRAIPTPLHYSKFLAPR